MIALSATSGKSHYQKSEVFAHPENQTLESIKRLPAETAAELDALVPAILDRAFKGGYEHRIEIEVPSLQSLEAEREYKDALLDHQNQLRKIEQAKKQIKDQEQSKTIWTRNAWQSSKHESRLKKNGRL